MSNVEIIERGWGAHFIYGSYCHFRRNTLVKGPKDRVIISTVGNLRGIKDGAGTYYETIVFGVEPDGPYLDAKIDDKRGDYDGKQGIYAKCLDDLPNDVDNVANDMHEAAVAFYANLLEDE